MRNIRLFEQFKASSPMGYTYPNVICISSEGGWSAVGVVFPEQEKYIHSLEKMPGISIETLADKDGGFVVLDGQGMNPIWKVVGEGDVYTSNEGYVFPIMQGKFFVALAAGHTVDFDIVKPELLSRL